jgi:hypothetical protein
MQILDKQGRQIPAHLVFSHAGATISVSTLMGRPEIAVFFDGGEGGRRSVGPVSDIPTAMRIAEIAQVQKALVDGHL